MKKRLIDLIENTTFHEAYLALSPEGVTLIGEDEAGGLVLEDLDSIGHLLIGGACGSGKTVCINSLVVSMLLGDSRDRIKFVMIDPKAVELYTYRSLPNLLCPIITTPSSAIHALEGMAGEMDGRKRTPKTHMPRIVIVIDEVVDLLNSAPMAEDLLLRILEGGAEVGIHLIMSAQCPTSHSLSAVLSRVPSRICMRVLSEVASQTLIGVRGGEQLLGEGDMLFVPHGALSPLHIRGAYLSDSEIMAVVDYISEENGGKNESK